MSSIIILLLFLSTDVLLGFLLALRLSLEITYLGNANAYCLISFQPVIFFKNTLSFSVAYWERALDSLSELHGFMPL